MFIKVAEIVTKKNNNVLFINVGNGPQSYEDQLLLQCKERNLNDKIIWLNSVDDMVSFYNAIDIFIFTSTSEGMPNAVGEALCCGVPCVSSAVGDVKELVNDNRFIVSDPTPDKFAERIYQVLDNKIALEQPEKHMAKEFSVSKLAERTESAMMKLL